MNIDALLRTCLPRSATAAAVDSASDSCDVPDWLSFKDQLWDKIGQPEPWEVDAYRRCTMPLYRMSPSDWVEKAVLVPDPESHRLVPFSFDQRRYLRKVYDTTAPKRLLMAGRQVEKSSTLAFMLLALCALHPGFRVLYVTPSSLQTKEFSKAKLTETIETCPIIRAWFPRSLTGNIFEKQAINRARILMRYAFLTADRCRGVSADLILLDEIQDLILDNIAVIEQAASHSSHNLRLYSGTPKSLDNPIQHHWARLSTRNEWAVPCERHGVPGDPSTWHWNILGERNIARAGLVCDKQGCGRPISPQHPMADWVRTGPPLDAATTPYEAFRIPQLMVPWVKWDEIWSGYTTGMSRSRFYNEVLGLAYDSGQRPLSTTDLQRFCDPNFSMSVEALKLLMPRLAGVQMYAGTDWGQDSTHSYTVFVLGCWLDGHFRIIYADRLTGSGAGRDEQVYTVKQLMKVYKVKRIGLDFGGGLDPNAALEREYGSERTMKIQWCAPSQYMVYDHVRRVWLANRTAVMSALFRAIRQGVMRFPRWPEWKSPFGDDMVSNYSEYSERTHMTTFDKSVNSTDDTLHAVFYCFLAAMMDHPRPDLFTPSVYVDQRINAQKAASQPTY